MAPVRSPFFSRSAATRKRASARKLRMWILDECLEDFLGASGIALREQPVGKIEQLRRTRLLAVGLTRRTDQAELAAFDGQSPPRTRRH